MAPFWKEIVAEKKQRQQAAIPKEWILTNLPSEEILDVTMFPESSGLLSTKDIEFTNSSVEILLEKLANGTWSSVEVTTAFSKRAVIAHQLTNCLTEIFIDRALNRAAELDQHLKTTGKAIGPLHGLPISLKDQISLKGIESTMGYVSWIGKYAERNAVLVDILESLGAVLYVKTNIPQTLMWAETFNHVFGRTSNPNNRSLTSGGSSGGEGALIALKGAPLGVGSDTGGSVRIPSGFCGTYGFRPSYGRIPYAGSVNSMEGQDSIPSVLGPLCNSISGLKIFFQAVMSQEPWLRDPLAVRKRWDNYEYGLNEHNQGKELCFAILWTDQHVLPHPPIIRGLEITKKALIAAGHKVVDWKPYKHEEIYKSGLEIWGSGLAEDTQVSAAPTGEPIITTMSVDQDKVTEDPPFIVDRTDNTKVSAYGLWQLQKKKRDLRQEYLDHWQTSAGLTGTGRPVDAIISPVAQYAAPPHGMNKSANYTVIWSVLDYPVVVVPVSKVDQRLDQKKPAHQFFSKEDKANYETYSPETFKNAPISVQVVGRTLEEEAVIAMAEIVDAALEPFRRNVLGRM